MDRTDQFAALAFAGESKIVARVDYQTCDQCGFRLMRVETTTIGEQHLVAMRCPICKQFDHDHPGRTDVTLLADERSQYFDRWSSLHNLNRETLESHYHLRVEHFFDDD